MGNKTEIGIKTLGMPRTDHLNALDVLAARYIESVQMIGRMQTGMIKSGIAIGIKSSRPEQGHVAIHIRGKALPRAIKV